MRTVGFAVAAVALVTLATSGRARAQYVNPYTGTNWNNPVSSSIDTSLQLSRQRMMLENSLASQRALAAEQLQREKTLQAGKERITRGKATTRFGLRPFDVQWWLKRWNPKTAEEKQRLVDECRAQNEIWVREAKARGVDLKDMADAAALAFVLNYEVLSGGDKASAKAFARAAQGIRDGWLKDAYFQGMADDHKQYMHDGIFLSGTDPMRRVLKGKASNDPAELAQARKQARDHLAKYWEGSVDKLRATPDKFTSLP